MRRIRFLSIITAIVVITGVVSTNADAAYEGLFWKQLVDDTYEVETAIPIGGFAGEEGIWWLAEDFEADSDYSYEAFYLHYFYDSVHCNGDTEFEIYEDDLNSAPIAVFTVETSDIYEETAGWTYVGNPIYLGIFDFGPNDIFLSSGHEYWTAFSMDADDGVFTVAYGNIYFSSTQYRKGSGGWDQYGVGFDISMGMLGDPVIGNTENDTLDGIKSTLE